MSIMAMSLYNLTHNVRIHVWYTIPIKLLLKSFDCIVITTLSSNVYHLISKLNHIIYNGVTIPFQLILSLLILMVAILYGM